MSQSPTLVTEEHARYVASHCAREDDFLETLRRNAKENGLPEIAISAPQGALLQVLLRLRGARNVIEVGTLGGYSAVWMARALPPDGRVRTIEIDPARAAFARNEIAKSDVAERVEVICGDGNRVLAGFAAESADAAFLDADKKSYGAYLEQCLRILRPGGLVAVDNAFAFGQILDAHPTDPEVPAVRAFNEAIARDARLDSVIVPLGDGMWVGVKR